MRVPIFDLCVPHPAARRSGIKVFFCIKGRFVEVDGACSAPVHEQIRGGRMYEGTGFALGFALSLALTLALAFFGMRGLQEDERESLLRGTVKERGRRGSVKLKEPLLGLSLSWRKSWNVNCIACRRYVDGGNVLRRHLRRHRQAAALHGRSLSELPSE